MAESTEGQEEGQQDDVAALKEERDRLLAKQGELLRETKKAKDAAKKYEGIDPEEYKTLKQQAEEAERKRAEAVGDWKAREAQLLEKVQKDIDSREMRIKTLSSALERKLVDAEATAAIAAAKGSAKVLLPHIKAHVKVVEEDGEFVVHVVDAKGNQRIGDAKGSPMTISQLVEEMKQDPDFARNFEGSGSSGGGASKSTAGGGGRKTISADEMANYIDEILEGSVKVA